MKISKIIIPLVALSVLATGCKTTKTTVREEIVEIGSNKKSQEVKKPYMRPVLAARLGMKDDIYSPKRIAPAIAGTLSSQQTSQMAYAPAKSEAQAASQVNLTAFTPYQGEARSVDERERECLARTMYFEAQVINHASLMAVGTVVANRRDSNRFPNSYCEVASQPGQFTSNPLERSITKEELSYASTVANQIIQGIRYPGFHGVYYFRTSKTPLPDRDRIQIVGDIGGNTFFKY